MFRGIVNKIPTDTKKGMCFERPPPPPPFPQKRPIPLLRVCLLRLEGFWMTHNRGARGFLAHPKPGRESCPPLPVMTEAGTGRFCGSPPNQVGKVARHCR